MDHWINGDTYESYVGRWSRLVARKFLEWLSIPKGSRWLDIGCGTGGLSSTILELAAPQEVLGIDLSEGYIRYAGQQVQDSRVKFQVGDAQALPVDALSYDVVVSGLALNFFPQTDRAISGMANASRVGGAIAAYVWDYAGKMQMMRHFWNAASALDPHAFDLDEGRRFPVCNPKALTQLFREAGLRSVETTPIDIDTDFKDFADYWEPFLIGQAPAPGYAATLSPVDLEKLRKRIQSSLPFALDGSIPLVARAWAVRGTVA